MNLNTRFPIALATAAALFASTAGIVVAADAPQSGTTALAVRAHAGSQSIDVTGSGPANGTVTVTVVSTISRDIPDVVLSRKLVKPNADGSFSAILPIAPGFTPGSIITVYAASSAGGPAMRAQYSPEAPNRGVTVQLDQLPNNVR
jgi:uncharacterized lipoprotein YbaY